MRGNRKAFQAFVDAFTTSTSDDAGLRVAIVHAEAPGKMAQLEKMVRDLRPHAQIELETTVGPVLGAHAGPGAVGFAWFEDED